MTPIKRTLAGIINSEVLGLETTEAEEPAAELWGDAASGSVLDEVCPKCRNGYIREWEGQYRCWNCGHVMQDHEEMERLGVEAEPPVLHPKLPRLGDPSGPALRYRRRDGTSGVIFFAKDSVEIIGNRVNLSPQGGFERYAIALDQVHNPEVLEPAAPDVPEGELPPMLEPQGIYVGDVTGKELRYSRRDGSTGTIYFDPDTVEIVDSALHLRGRVVLSPQGRPERYSIALDQVHNPEALFEVPEPEPEREPAQFRPGTRVVIDEVPLDSYEAVQVMRRLKPELGPFEILEALKHKPATLLQGYREERALSIGEELEATGCTVRLQTVGEPAS